MLCGVWVVSAMLRCINSISVVCVCVLCVIIVFGAYWLSGVWCALFGVCCGGVRCFLLCACVWDVPCSCLCVLVCV